MDTEFSTLPMVTDAAEADVDLVAVVEGTVAALREETTVPTILETTVPSVMEVRFGQHDSWGVGFSR